MEVTGKPEAYRRGGVSVRIGSAPVRQVREVSTGLTVVGICPADAPWLATLYPHAIIKDTRFRERSAAVEYIRLEARDDVVGLPGLTSPAPSRIRDSVMMALSVGAPRVNVILARVKGAQPWDLGRLDVFEVLEPFLNELLSGILLFPDLGGPFDIGPGTGAPLKECVEPMLSAVQRLSDTMRSRYQVGLIDLPQGADQDRELYLDMLRSLIGADVCMCTWRGEPHRIRAHGWRSAAAVVGGVIAADGVDVGRGLAGRTIQLPPGRKIRPSRRELLVYTDEPRHRFEGEEALIQLQLHGRRQTVQVLNEPSFRPPLGDWPLPALRTVKVLHHLLVHAAEEFVFGNADEAQAMALASALQRALRRYAARGLIVGPGGSGLPDVRGNVLLRPGEASLGAVVTAVLQPWSQGVTVRVVVKPGGQAEIDVQ